MAWKDKKENIEIMLNEGEFECEMCDHIETNLDYLFSDKGSFCTECGVGLHY